jgi:CRISPR type I-D-associated protein Csc2
MEEKIMERFVPYLADINQLVETSAADDKNQYIHPKRKSLGCVSLVLMREAIAPVVFRNLEQEITDIEVGDDVYVRGVPNKFKYPERGRGLQILRVFGVGGRLPQNKTVLLKGQKPSDAYDLNTLVFGDSANQENRILPVRTAVNYSDALSLLPKHLCVEETFHNRAFEDGTLFDAATKRNSENLFTRHFIKPGTLMVQVLSTQGRVLPKEGLDHLLLAVGLAGSYGGQTGVTGVNIRTHLVGLYGARFERAETSPYEIVKDLDCDKADPGEASAAVHSRLASLHETAMDAPSLIAYQKQLVERFAADDEGLKLQYKTAGQKVGELFDNWFGTGK